MSELLVVEGLDVEYPVGAGLGRRRRQRVVKDVSLRVDPGRAYGLVGESGSGKSTTGRAILRLVRPAGGRIAFDGHDVTAFGRRIPSWYREAVQVVFQNPTSALNPTMKVGALIAEPVRLRRQPADGTAVDRMVVELLEQVGLAPNVRARYPFELSGGQRQRVSIARALAVQPRLLVLDEPVSALDVSTQGQVINLLEDLQAALGIAYLFVAHDLAVVRHLCDDVGVMYAGRLVEDGPAERVYSAPAHPYTAALLAAAPVPDPAAQRLRRDERRRLRVGSDAPIAPGAVGCEFATRCPLVRDVCRAVAPEPVAVVGGGTVRCHVYAPATEPVPGPAGSDVARRVTHDRAIPEGTGS